MILDGYIRVSQVAGRSGESFISPAVQREQIERWAAAHGVLIGEVLEELDESGGRRDRPVLETAIRRVERGDSNGLAVPYMSRFGRSLLDALLAIERITKVGGTFVSVQEGLDFSTDIGRHMLRQMLSWAEWELHRTRMNWSIARQRAVARGVWMASRPFGYRAGPTGQLEADRDEGPIVTGLFRRRASGASVTELLDSLVEKGVRTTRGSKQWHHTSLCRLFAARSYRGEIRHGEFFNPKGHEPLIDEVTWQRAQRDHLDHLWVRPRRGGQGALLRGIVRCSGCQRPLVTTVAFVGSSFEQRRYRCIPRSIAEPCPASVGVSATLVEPYVEMVFWQELERTTRAPSSKRLDRLRTMVDRRDGELDAYRDNASLPKVIGPDRFAEGLAIRVRRVEQARVELLRAQPQDHTHALPPAANLRSEWTSMSVDERRTIIGQVIECVFVLSGVTGTDRLFICRRRSAPEGLPPRHPRQATKAHPFDPSTCPARVRLRRTPDWTEERVRTTLTEFLAGRKSWPPFSEFQAAGHTFLYAQVERLGGPRFFASLLGVPWTVRPARKGPAGLRASAASSKRTSPADRLGRLATSSGLTGKIAFGWQLGGLVVTSAGRKS